MLLDTGEALKVETISGAELKKRGLDAGEPVADATQIVVISFPAVKAGQSARLRITETYTDPNRYRLDGDELVWDRAFGRPRNAVVLPAGWTVVASSTPGSITQDPDGRQRLYFENNRNDEIQVLIRARRVARNSALRQHLDEQGLLRVQAVLGLIEDHRDRRLDHFVADLLAAMRGEAVHEERAGLGERHHALRSPGSA